MSQFQHPEGSSTVFVLKAMCCGELISQVLVLKVGVPHVGFKPFPLQGDAPDFESPSGCWVTMRGAGFMAILCPSLSCLLLSFA